MLVFDDPLLAQRSDPRSDEERWHTIGATGGVVVIVAHTWPEPQHGTEVGVGRIVSARKATAHERGRMKKGISESLLEKQKAEIEDLAALPDDEIDTSDLPEILDWSGASRGLLYRPVKQQITLRLDADVVAWFKANAPGGREYQTEINRVLREHARRVPRA